MADIADVTAERMEVQVAKCAKLAQAKKRRKAARNDETNSLPQRLKKVVRSY